MTGLPPLAALAVVVARDGVLPPGTQEAIGEAGGSVLVLGEGAGAAAEGLSSAPRRWYADTGPGAPPGALSAALAPLLAAVDLAILPASADGRDLAPRLAAVLGRPLLAGAVRVSASAGPLVEADLWRAGDRLCLPVRVQGPAVATVLPGCRDPRPPEPSAPAREVTMMLCVVDDAGCEGVTGPLTGDGDLATARVVLAGGAGLVAAGTGDEAARRTYRLLERLAERMGGAAGVTRVVTDAGWAEPDRQIGTTGVGVQPALYLAFGVSGASQHLGGVAGTEHVVSVNTDPACPMTAAAGLGLVTDAAGLLAELAVRYGVSADD